MRSTFISLVWYRAALLLLACLAIIGIMPAAAKQATLSPATPMAGDNTIYLPLVSMVSLSLDDFIPEGGLFLSGISPTRLNPRDTPLTFNLIGAHFWQHSPSDTSLTINNKAVPRTNISISANSITANQALINGKNVIRLVSIDEAGRPLYFNSTIWAGSNTLHVNVVNKDGTPFTEAVTVTVSLVDDQMVQEQATTSTGEVDFANVPPSTILVRAIASGNRVGAIGVIGGANNVTVTLLGFDSPSNVDNNDFSQGTSGWNIGSAPVQLIPHQENVGPAFGAATSAPSAPLPARRDEQGQRDLEDIQRVEAASQQMINSLAVNAVDDNDLQLGTSGEGPRSISRTFQTDPEVSAIRLRYRFVTSEVPGGYFGSQFNDYFSVSIRSQTGGGSISESNSMNGLGLGSFDAIGSTAWQDVILPVEAEGDVIQVDMSVANVADGLYQSQFVIDFIEGIRVRVIPTLRWNSTQGGLDLSYRVEGGELSEDRDITVSFANGPEYANRMGDPVFTYRVPQGTPEGQFGPVHIPGNSLTGDPAGTTHFVAASSPNSVGALADVRIGFGANANAAVVSQAMVDLIKDGLRVAGQANATITSTARTPADQARAMFNNLINPARPIAANVQNQLALYAAAGDAVVNAFVIATQGMTLEQIRQNSANIRAAMVQEINNQGCENVSRHCADPNQLSVVDVSAGQFNATTAALFVGAVSPPARLLDERRTNNCFHLEL